MVEETFRRTPISIQELNNIPTQPLNSNPTPVYANVPNNVPEVVNNTDFPPVPVPTANMSTPSDGPGLQVSQNMPPEFMNRIKQGSSQPAKTQYTNNSVIRATGSEKLEELIKKINPEGMMYGEVTLPSLGKFYNGSDGPVDGKIHVRPITGAEESFLATQRFIKDGTVLNRIFDECMMEKQYRSENFLAIDRTFLLIWLRGISYSPEYEVEITCPFTDKKFIHSINLNLDVEECPEDFGPSSMKDTLPTTGFSFSYRLATGRDELEIQKRQEKKNKNFNIDLNRPDDDFLNRLAVMINDIEGLTDKNELGVLLAKLPGNDIAYLKSVIDEPPFGVNTKVSIVSPYSSEEFEIELPLDSNFFLPKTKKKVAQS